MERHKHHIITIFCQVSVLVIPFILSCSTVRETGLAPEDQLFVTRKYAGNFVGFSPSSPYYHGGPGVISISTTLDTVYGKISAYSRKCEFQPGERLYIRKVYVKPGVFGNWKYQIENDRDKKITYGIMEFRFGDKVLVQNWF